MGQAVAAGKIEHPTISVFTIPLPPTGCRCLGHSELQQTLPVCSISETQLGARKMQEGKQSQAAGRSWPASFPRPPSDSLLYNAMDHRVPTSLNAIQFPQECAGKPELGRLNYRSENDCFSCLKAASHSVVLPRESPCFAP